MLPIRRCFLLLTMLTAVALPPGLRAQIYSSGFIDPAFNAACLTSGSSFTTRALAVQSDGKILAGGNYTTGGGACVNGLVRLRTNGATDLSFAAPLVPGSLVTSLALVPGGKMLVGGRMSTDGSVIFPLARLLTNGTVDLGFARNIPDAASLGINSLAVQADGKIIAAGAFFQSTNVFGYILRLGANGAVDPTFVNGVTAPTPSLSGQGFSAVVTHTNDKTIVGGSFTQYFDGVLTLPRDGLARLTSDGHLDISFVPRLSHSDVRALLVQPDGKILVAGLFDVDGLPARCLTRLNADGSRDTTFTNLNGNGTTGLSLALQADGKILFGHSSGVLRLTTNGVIDSTFGPLNAAGFLGTDATTVSALAFTYTPEEKILVGATRVGISGTERRGVAQLYGYVPPPPFITQQPRTQTVDAGTNVTFSVMATGAPPLFYQWRKDGVSIKGATNMTFNLTNVHSTDIANYSVLITNIGGPTISDLARLIVEFQTSPLFLSTNGLGVVLPRPPALLEIGRPYTVTAKPIVGNLFSNWTGGVTSSSPVLTFVMQSNFVLVVNFVPSPFIAVKGIFNGLFYDTNTPAHGNAGAFSLALDDKGGVRGTVRQGTKTRKFTGTFSLERTARILVPATATEPALSLALEIDYGTATITGLASNAHFVSTITAYRNPFSPQSRSAPTVGNYNAALPGADAASAPVGDGFATFAVSTAGRVSGKFTLADSSSFSLVTATAAGAQVPVYAPLYAGRGSLFGWLTVTNSASNDVAGPLWWTKPVSVGGALYPAGFTNQTEVLGSRYFAPPARTPVLTLTNGAVLLSGDGLVDALTNSITLGGDNKIAAGNGIALTLVPAKGAVTGSFLDPVTGKKHAVQGVALPKQNEARGFFLGTGANGRMRVGEPTVE